MSEFRHAIRADLRRRTDADGGVWVKQLLETGFWAVLLYRIAVRLRRSPLHLFGRLVYNLNIVLTGADLDPDWPCGPGLYIPHPVGVVMAGTVGSNVTLFSGCTIGGIGKPGDAEGLPVVHDDCVVFTGARVLGPIVLGRGTRVGANSVVLKSTPPDSLAVGIPARVRRLARKRERGLAKVAHIGAVL
jgi:serine O-acetyltransferase